MDQESKEKTPFIVYNNVYERNRLTFGLTNAPGTFQRLMHFVLRSVLGKNCLVYLDDIMVFSENPEDYFRNLKQIFALLDEANLKTKLSKCNFLRKSVQFLGHKIWRCSPWSRKSSLFIIMPSRLPLSRCNPFWDLRPIIVGLLRIFPPLLIPF